MASCSVLFFTSRNRAGLDVIMIMDFRKFALYKAALGKVVRGVCYGFVFRFSVSFAHDFVLGFLGKDMNWGNVLRGCLLWYFSFCVGVIAVVGLIHIVRMIVRRFHNLQVIEHHEMLIEVGSDGSSTEAGSPWAAPHSLRGRFWDDSSSEGWSDGDVSDDEFLPHDGYDSDVTVYAGYLHRVDCSTYLHTPVGKHVARPHYDILDDEGDMMVPFLVHQGEPWHRDRGNILVHQSSARDVISGFLSDPAQFARDCCCGVSITDERCIAVIEKHVLLVANVMQCKSVAHVTTVILAYISNQYEGKLALSLKVYMNELFFSMEQQGFADSLQEIWDYWGLVKNGDLVRKFKKLFGVLASAGVCSMAGMPFCLKKFEDTWAGKLFDGIVSHNLVGFVVEAVIAFYKGGLRAYQTGSVWSLFTDSAIAEYDDAYCKVMSHEVTYFGHLWTPLHDVQTPEDYEQLAYRTWKKTEAIIKTADLSPAAKAQFDSKREKLAKLWSRILQKRATMSMRQSPYSLMWWGDTGVAKTATLAESCIALAVRNGLKPDPKLWVSLNSDDKYTSEYDGSQEGVIIDDLGNTSPKYAESTCGAKIIAIVNNNPLSVLKAEVDLKGAIFWAVRFLMVTTNIRELHTSETSAFPIAVMRRFNHIIRVRVKDDYKLVVNGVRTDMIDNSRLGAPGTNDCWLFDVEVAVPSTDVGMQHKVCYAPVPGMTGVDFHTLLKFIGDKSVEHLNRQRSYVDGVASLYKEGLCQHSSFKGICPECRQQSDLEHQAQDSLLLEYLTKQKWWRDHWAASLPGVGFAQDWMAKALVERYFRGNGIVTTAVGVALASVMAIGGTATYLGGVAGLASLYACMVLRGVVYLRASDAASRYSVADLAKAQSSLWLKTLVAVSGAMSVLYLLRTFLRAAGVMNPQGAVHSIPKPDEKPRENPWVKAHLSAQVLQPNMHRADHAQVASVVKGTMCVAGFSGGDHPGQKCCLQPLYSNIWVVPLHVADKNYTSVDGMYVSDGGISRNFSIRIGPKSWVRIGTGELAAICLPGAGDQRDIRKYLPITNTTKGCSAEFIYMDSQCDFLCGDAWLDCSLERTLGYEGEYVAMSGRYPFPTKYGMCGGVALTNTITPYLAGFHVAGEPNGGSYGRCCQVTLSEFQEAADKLHAMFIHPKCASHDGYILQSAKYGVELLGRIHDKSPMNYQESAGNLLLLGAHNGQRRKMVSRVETSVISDTVHKIMGEPRRHGPPKNYGNSKPWHLDAAGMLAVVQPPVPELEWACQDYMDKVSCLMESERDRVQEISPLADCAVLSGVPGVVGIDSVDLSTGAGWPRNKPKKHFLDVLHKPGEVIEREIVPDGELSDEIADIDSRYRAGLRSNLVFRVSLKDEPTKLDKEKVRTIAGAPAALLFLCRKYYLPVAKFMRDFGFVFETAVGIVAQGPEWTDLAMYLHSKGGGKIAGDYGAFDTTMCAYVTMMAFAVMIRVAQQAGYTESDITVMWGIATDICYPIYEFNGEFVKSNGSMPSGHPMTVFINGIVNAIYMRMAYHIILCGMSVPTSGMIPFHDVVSLITYGDDNVMDVSPGAPYFNHTAIAHALGGIGLKYTMADKLAPSVPYIPFSEVTFLKRSFVLDEQTGRYFAPLEELSLFKMLHCTLATGAMTSKEHSAMNVLTFLEEAFWHGEEYYETRRSQLVRVVDECSLGSYIRGAHLPSYAEAREVYLNRYPLVPALSV